MLALPEVVRVPATVYIRRQFNDYNLLRRTVRVHVPADAANAITRRQHDYQHVRVSMEIPRGAVARFDSSADGDRLFVMFCVEGGGAGTDVVEVLWARYNSGNSRLTNGSLL